MMFRHSSEMHHQYPSPRSRFIKSGRIMNGETLDPANQGTTAESLFIAPTTMPLFWWGDAFAILLFGASLFSASMLKPNWVSTPDRAFFWMITTIGLFAAGLRSKWEGVATRKRTQAMAFCWTFSLGFFVWGFLSNNVYAFAVVNFFAVMGWCLGRIRGESSSFGLKLALVSACPLIVSALIELELFESLQTLLVVVTSSLVDLFNVPHAKDGSSLIFSLGILSDFACIGFWDGMFSAIGITIAWNFLCGRTQMNLLFSVLFGCAIWIAIRSAGFCLLAVLSHMNKTWYEVTFFVRVGLFAMTCVCLFVSDYFISEFLKPIPLKLDMEAPILAYSFNWIAALPQVKLAIPKQSENYSMWMQQLNSKGIQASTWTRFRWLMREYVRFFTNPAWTFAGVSDALRGWIHSRRTILLYSTSIFLVVPLAILSFGLLALFGRGAGYAERLTEQSHQFCSNARLEEHCVALQESDFCKAIGIEYLGDPQSTQEPIQQEELRYLELLSMRIVDHEPSNLSANYRLGLIWAAIGNSQKASTKMAEVASGAFGSLPESNGWLAKDLINRRALGEAIEFSDILRNIEIGSSWKGIDHRLLLGNAKFFAAQGKSVEAVEFTKLAVALKPDLILELASLYRELNHADFVSTAHNAEAFFLKRIGVPSEQEIDRMSVAEARVLLEQLDLAEQTLLEGLERGIGSERMRRQLSEIQFRQHLVSIEKADTGKFSADLALLEKAAATDPTNPSISTGIARLLTMKMKPSRQLVDVLREQIKSGTTSVPAHLSLGEAYYGIGRYDEAEMHWELALKGDPNSVVALNNLALSSAIKPQPDLKRAVELISKAQAIAPQNPSVLDTYGEILILSQRPKEAINKLELAIRYDNDRIGSRKKLVSAYQAAGLNDMAAAQSQVIEQIEASEKAEKEAAKDATKDNSKE